MTPILRKSTASEPPVSSARTVVWVPSEGAYSNVVACGIIAEQPVVPRMATNAKPAKTFRRVVVTFTMVLFVIIRCGRGDVLPCIRRRAPTMRESVVIRLLYLTLYCPLYDKISRSVVAHSPPSWDILHPKMAQITLKPVH